MAIIDWIVETVSFALIYIYEWLRDVSFTILEPVLSYISSSPFGSFDFLPTELFSYLNFFFPLSELITVTFALFSFWLYILAIKILLKVIPMIY